MTKERVEEIVKRYPFVIKAIKEGKKAAEFQISKRNFQIGIVEEDIVVCEIFEEIRRRERDPDVLRMINGLRKVRTDTAIMQDVHWRKNAYYDRKSKLIDKILQNASYMAAHLVRGTLKLYDWEEADALIS